VAAAFENGSGTTYASRTNTTVTAPTGIANGDILLGFILTATAGTPPTPSLPSGFSQIGSTTDVSGAGGFVVRAVWCIKVASGESGDYTFTHSSTSSQGWIGRFSGCDTTTPQDATSTYNSASGSAGNTTTTWTGLTTVTNGALLVAMEHDFGDSANNLSAPSGMTERRDTSIHYVATEVFATAGATGNRTHTNNNVGGGGNDAWQARLVALRPATGGAYTLDATTSASYAITGTAVSALLGRRVDAATTPYAITGTTAGTYLGRKIAADTIAYTISGTTVSFLKTWILDAAAGSHLISGTSAGTLHGWLVDAAPAAYAIGGSDVTLRRALPLGADAGSHSISGTAAGMLHGWLVSVAPDSYTIDGQDVTLTKLAAGTLTADPGIYLITGADVSLLASHALLGADPGSYEITGGDVTLYYTRLLDAESGSYAIDGSPATLTYSGEVTPEPEPEPEPPARTHGGGGRWGTSGRRIVWPKKKREEWQEYVRDEIRRLYGTLDVEEAVEAVAPYIPAEVDPRAVQAVVRALVPSVPLAEIKRAVAPLVEELDLIALDEDFLRFVEARWQNL
jgi:hypothetical protein